MSKELINIEKTERYLLGEMEPGEKKDFKTELADNEELNNLTKLQKELMEGVKRKVLQDQVKRASRHYNMIQNLKFWGIAWAILIAGLAAWFMYNSDSGLADKLVPQQDSPKEILLKTESDSTEAIALLNQNMTGPVKTMPSMQRATSSSKYLPVQLFAVSNDKDTVIETKGGIIYVIPAQSALDSKGNIPKGKVVYALQEALSPEEIMSAGLDTRSGGKLLETGGMFYVSASQGNETLQLNPQKSILVQVPSEEPYKSGMKLYDGYLKPDSSINWKDPKPLDNFLVPVDILSLDFYPPDYLNLLKKESSLAGKAYADSLYYSFAADKSAGKEWINPLTIKTIWNRKYNNTLLATREFESRLKLIHTTCNKNEVLELYIRNLDKNLYEIDLLAVELLDGDIKEKFRAFAMEKKGNINSSSTNAQALAQYFEQKKSAHQKVLEKTYVTYLKQLEALSKRTKTVKNKLLEEDEKRDFNNLQREIELNKQKVFKELGINPLAPSWIKSWSFPAIYTTTIRSFGWCNIDMQVENATIDRNSDTFKYKGKTSSLKYASLEISLRNENYEKTEVYLLPHQLYSFIRMTKTGKGYEEKLNADTRYDLICVGWEENEKYLFSSDAVKAGRMEDVKLLPASDSQFAAVFARYKNKPKADMRKELEYQMNLLALERQQARIKLNQLKIARLKGSLFPCQRESLEESFPDSTVKIEGEKKLKQFGF